MPLAKKQDGNGSLTQEPQISTGPACAAETPKHIGGTHAASDRIKMPMTKDDYWRRREERDVQRDKDMAWSGLAQASLDSIGLVQLNTANTLESYIELVVRATNLLLQARDKHNS